MNRLIEECNYDDISYVIIDEFHLVSEAHRGQQIEMLISKILSIEELYHKRIQVVAMTATLTHIDVYQRWLHASIYENQHRPIPLTEFVKVDAQLLSPALDVLAVLPKPVSDDKDHVGISYIESCSSHS